MNRKKAIKNQRGSAAVEFALILMPLLLIIFAAIDFGFAFYNYQVIRNACREGARTGIVVREGRCDPSDLVNIENVVKSYSDSYLVSLGDTNTVVFNKPISCLDREGNFSNSFGSELTISVKYDYPFWFFSFLGLGPWEIKAESKMKLE